MDAASARAAAAAALPQYHHRRRPLLSAISPVIELLEERRLLAVELVDGVISWTGTDADDKFVAQVRNTQLIVSADGVATKFPLSQVRAVFADGGLGNDRILINQDRAKFLVRTTLIGGDGDDTIVGGSARDAIRGGFGFDSLTGMAANDNIAGEADADTIDGGGNDDKLDGGDGDDSMRGGGGNDAVLGALGIDLLFGDDGDDTITAGEGDDRADGGGGNDRVDGELGNDTLGGGSGRDRVSGNAGDDKLQGDKGDDRIFGGSGADLIFGRTAKVSAPAGGSEGPWGGTELDNDEIYGGDDADVICGDLGDDLILGEGGDDSILGGDGWDDLAGGDGHDTIDGEAGEDRLDGGTGSDWMNGSGDADLLDGGAEGDVMSGGAADDTLVGGDGNDWLGGDPGNDLLDGQLGADSLVGGDGADTFVATVEDLTDKNDTDPGGQPNMRPSIASISSSVDPVIVGNTVTLRANGVSDLDGTIIAVRFYRESNGVFGLQTGLDGDVLITTDTSASDGWATVINTNGMEPGDYEFHAQATDNGLAVTDVVSTALTAEMPLNLRPVIGSLLPSVDPVDIGATFGLWAGNVTDPDGSVRSVTFYEETNGVAGLQTGAGGDRVVGNGTRTSTSWSIMVSTTGRSPGALVFYAVASDNGFGRGLPVSTTVNLRWPPNKVPKVIALAPSRPTIIAGETLGLTATGVSDPDGTVTQVRFYYEFNGIDGLQVGAGGDAFVAASDAPVSTQTWTVNFSTAGWNAGAIRFYAQATDDDGELGNAATAVVTIEPTYLVDVAVDNAAATLVGTWTSGTSAAGYHGADYLHDGNELPGAKSATFAYRLPQASVYEVYAQWPADLSHASNAQVDIIDSAGVTHTVTVNQRQNGGAWVLLGQYHFNLAADAVVRFRTDGADGYVVADAVRFATKNRGPVIGSFVDSPASVRVGQTLTIQASNIIDRDGSVASVSFYRETNGIAGLQTGGGGDLFLGVDTTMLNGSYFLTFTLLDLAPGTYTYYAQATDEEGATGSVASVINVVIV